jgi:Flp pilus assembly protein TadB
MKTIVLLVLLGCFVLAMPAAAYASAATHSQDRSARNGLKQQAKAQKKYAKARRKAERKMLKTERKNTKLPPRHF